MTGLPPCPRARCQVLGHQGRGRRHQSVQQNRRAPHRSLGQEPGHRGQVGTAAHPQEAQRIAGHGAGSVERVAYRTGLAHPAEVVDTGAAAHHDDRFGTGQCCHQSCCSRGISDAHIAGDEQVGAGVDLLIGDLAACFHRCRRLLGAQCIFHRDVAGAAAHLVGADRRRQRLIAVDGDVGDPHSGSGHLGQHVDRGPTGVEVRHHLAGHCGGNAETPAAVTPWSAAKTTTRARVSARGGHTPWHEAAQTASSSSRRANRAAW